MKVFASTLILFGLATFSHAIIRGYNAEEGQFPYHAEIDIAGSFICGGAILNEKFILTAASCVASGSGGA